MESLTHAYFPASSTTAKPFSDCCISGAKLVPGGSGSGGGGGGGSGGGSGGDISGAAHSEKGDDMARAIQTDAAARASTQ